MLTMGLDTALQRCSVAILRGETVVARMAEDMAKGHAERLAPMAAAVLDKAGVRVVDLDRIGVIVGPGGFTGVRVGLAFARGLAIGTGVPVVGVTSLAAIAANVEDHADAGLIGAVIDARRGQVYAGLYGADGTECCAPFVAAPEAALQTIVDAAAGAPVALVGSGAGLLPVLSEGWTLSQADPQIDPVAAARLAAAAPAPSGPPAPLYLRGPDAKPPKPGLFDGRVGGRGLS